MADVQEVKVVRLHRFDSDSKTKAFADIAIGDFIVKGLRVVEGKKGLFLSMPQEKSKDGKAYKERQSAFHFLPTFCFTFATNLSASSFVFFSDFVSTKIL